MKDINFDQGFEYVIGLKIKTNKQVSFLTLPEIIKEQVSNGTTEIVIAESYENWKQEHESR